MDKLTDEELIGACRDVACCPYHDEAGKQAADRLEELLAEVERLQNIHEKTIRGIVDETFDRFLHTEIVIGNPLEAGEVIAVDDGYRPKIECEPPKGEQR